MYILIYVYLGRYAYMYVCVCILLDNIKSTFTTVNNESSTGRYRYR